MKKRKANTNLIDYVVKFRILPLFCSTNKIMLKLWLIYCCLKLKILTASMSIFRLIKNCFYEKEKLWESCMNDLRNQMHYYFLTSTNKWTLKLWFIYCCLKLKILTAYINSFRLWIKKTSMKKEKWPKVCICINSNCMEKFVMLIVATMILHVPNTKNKITWN